MNAVAKTIAPNATLPALIDRAVRALSGARNSAEVLEARDLASVAYDAAKKAARLHKAKRAHDDLISAAYRAQADALEIEAIAKRRLADEYDAAQQRGDVAGPKDGKIGRSKAERLPTAADLGLTRKDIHEARIIRNAEKADPGIISRTLKAAIERGEEPTRAKVRRAVGIARIAPPVAGSRRDAIRLRVRDAIMALSGLPRAQEVARYFNGTDTAIVISSELTSVAQWIADFATAWKEQHNV